jgi:hypothetical protein
MGRSKVMSTVRREINVGKYVLQLGPVFCFRHFLVVESIVDEITEVINEGFQIIILFISRLQQRFSELGLKRKARILGETCPNDIYMCAPQADPRQDRVPRRRRSRAPRSIQGPEVLCEPEVF